MPHFIMPHPSTLANTTYVGGGRVYKATWDDLRARLATLGATWNSAGLEPGIDFFIAGSGARGKETRARALDIPILDEESLWRLIAEAEGTSSHEERDDEEELSSKQEGLSQLIGEARSLLDRRGDLWTSSLELIARCQPPELEPLAAYLDDHLDAWAAQTTPGRWSPPKKHPLMQGVTKRWLEACPEDEPRVAPPSWIFDMAHGRRSPAFRLARALDLHCLQLNVAHVQQIIAHPDLGPITHLDLGEKNRCSAKLIAALGQSTLAKDLEHLVVRDDDRVAHWLCDLPANSFPELYTLTLHTYSPNALKAHLDEHLRIEPVEIRYVSLGWEMLPESG